MLEIEYRKGRQRHHDRPQGSRPHGPQRVSGWQGRALPGLLCVLGDDLGTGNIVAVLGGVGDRIPHPGKPALVDQINDQLHLMDALKIGVLGADIRKLYSWSDEDKLINN